MGRTENMKIKPTKCIQKLVPYRTASHKVWEYTYGKKTDIINSILKLDWNEATKIDKDLLKDILRFIVTHNIQLNWYPDTDNSLLLNEISKYVGLPIENIQYFGGSDSALEYICRTFISPRDKILIVGPTYDNFRVYAQSCGGKIILYLNNSPFEKNLKRLDGFIKKQKPKMVYIVNPNNPTGVMYTTDEIRLLLINNPRTLFIIDEAYYEFCKVTCASLVLEYQNIVITRSFTKAFALGAFRLGYILGPTYIINYINKIRVGKNINVFAQIAGIIALKNREKYMEAYVEEVNKSKNLILTELTSLGLKVYNTPANFILVKVKDGQKFVKLLEKELVFVRDRSSDAQLKGFVRITVGDLKTTEEFLKRIKKIIKENESSIF